MYTLLLFVSLWIQLLFTLFFMPELATKENVPADFAETPLTERLNWSPKRPLTWEDFKAVPDAKNPHHALTAANLAVNTKWTEDNLRFQVYCVFLPTESWSKNKVSAKLLHHEQLHFDLTEVFARRLRKELAQLHGSSQKEKARIAVSSVFDDWKAAQHAFDNACEHGLNAAQEHLWALYISQRLQALEAYK